MDAQLIDRIYECSFVPERWPEVLDSLAQMIDAPRGALFVYKGTASPWKATPSAREAVQRLLKEDWLARGQFMSRVLRLRLCGFFTDLDAFTREQLDGEPLYRDYLRPAGFGWGAATLVSLPTGEHVFLCLNRLLARGPVEAELISKLDHLRPHVARSVLISARLQLERAAAIGEALALVGLPALVLDGKGKVLAANNLVEALSRYVRWRAHDRVSLVDRVADLLLHDAMAAIDGTCSSGALVPGPRAPHGDDDGRTSHSCSSVGPRYLCSLRGRTCFESSHRAESGAG